VPPSGPTAGRWSILGQSFGGFCCATYLSLAPEGLLEALITGGIPPGITQLCSADDGEASCPCRRCRVCRSQASPASPFCASAINARQASAISARQASLPARPPGTRMSYRRPCPLQCTAARSRARCGRAGSFMSASQWTWLECRQAAPRPLPPCAQLPRPARNCHPLPPCVLPPPAAGSAASASTQHRRRAAQQQLLLLASNTQGAAPPPRVHATQSIVKHLAQHPEGVLTPAGNRLTPR
jgi:hypothetical protein